MVHFTKPDDYPAFLSFLRELAKIVRGQEAGINPVQLLQEIIETDDFRLVTKAFCVGRIERFPLNDHGLALVTGRYVTGINRSQENRYFDVHDEFDLFPNTTRQIREWLKAEHLVKPGDYL